MTPAPLRGVWSNPRPSAPAAPLSGWLVARIDEVGLDGSICAEFVLSLIELYAKSAGDRDAAITEFLSDSVAASSLKSEQLRDRFVQETVSGIRSRLSGNSVVTPSAPPAAAPPAPSAPAEPTKTKGFKKGIKLTGTALKEVVGNVKPSYVQKYSDDESAGPTIPVSRMQSTSSAGLGARRQSIDVAAFPSLEGGMQTPQAAEGPARTQSTRRRNKAREVGPDEDWDDHGGPTPWKTPAGSPSPPTKKKPAKKQLTVTTASPVVVVHEEVVVREPEVVAEPEVVVERRSASVSMAQTTPVVLNRRTEDVSPPAAAVETMTILDSLLLPQDIMGGFDFKFEGDDDHVEPTESPEPFDLLKQMFSLSGFSAPVVPVEVPVVVADADAEKRRYPVGYLLSVLRRMQEEQGEVAIPDELRNLTQSTVVSPEHPKAKQQDSNWRNVNKPESPENNGTWRASGYNNNRWNAKKRPDAPAAEEGFW